MNEVSVGVTLPQFTSDADVFVQGAARAEALGFDSIWLFDHLWPLGGRRERPILEAWTSLAWVAEATTRIKIGTLVTRSSLRHPALLAKMAATVGEIAPARVIVGIGAGDAASRAENEAFGLPYWSGAERVAQLRSTVEVLRRHFHEDVVSYEDAYATVRSLPASPRPSPSPALWVGGRADDALAVAGELADAWNGWGGTPERYEQDASNVLSYARGRDLELTWGGQILLGSDDDDARTRLGERKASSFVLGGPETVARELGRFVNAGARHLVLASPQAGEPSTYEEIARELLPRLRTSAPR